MGRPNRKQDQRVTWDKVARIADIVAACRTIPQGKSSMTKILELIQNIVFFDAATLYLLRCDKERLEEVASLGGQVELLSFLSVGAGDGLSGWTARNRKPILLSERSSISSFDPDNEYGTFLSLPLLAGDDVIGVLNLGCTEARAFTDKDVRLLTVVADQLALSIERVTFEERLRTISLELQETQEQLQQAQTKIPAIDRLAEIAPLAASVNNGINNALAVVVGNVQCLLSEKAAINQKMLSSLRRIENAALRISSLNQKVIELNALVQSSLPFAYSEQKNNLDKAPYENM